ncbi:capsid assembly scaffolding protein Gp46 family protein [Enterococcus sp. CSURQ0835]|uniref:capsid assembly scaffolding protein Gp46 family protein n=1 Tax=Enterococcus sp. CSURQ0835 TaxID=2681394 RepID=UPI00190F8B8A|nr:DUF4355 domain-containing protein [Enterococcus sp. CSURQ0835]
MKQKTLFPMNLQLFAEESQVEPEPILDPQEPESEPTAEDNPEGEEKSDDLDSEKVVEKLQKRLASKTKSEKETKSQLEQALARIEELEKGGKKNVKELSEEDKADEEQKAKDEEIAQLKRQIKIAEATQQADEVLKEAEIVAGKEVLSMIVSDDDEQTLVNVKALINYTNEQHKQWEKARNTGTTPKKLNSSTKKEYDLASMSYEEIAKLKREQPEVFKQLTK